MLFYQTVKVLTIPAKMKKRKNRSIMSFWIPLDRKAFLEHKNTPTLSKQPSDDNSCTDRRQGPTHLPTTAPDNEGPNASEHTKIHICKRAHATHTPPSLTNSGHYTQGIEVGHIYGLIKSQLKTRADICQSEKDRTNCSSSRKEKTCCSFQSGHHIFRVCPHGT